MFLLLSWLVALWLLVAPTGGGPNLKLQESLFLKSLGLSSRPNPVSPAPVPSVLWKIFKNKANLPPENRRAALCRVEELDVDGNIIRVFPDQGTALAPQTRGSLRESRNFSLLLTE